MPLVEPWGAQSAVPFRNMNSKQQGVVLRRTAPGWPANVGQVKAMAATAVSNGFIRYYGSRWENGTPLVSNLCGRAPPSSNEGHRMLNRFHVLAVVVISTAWIIPLFWAVRFRVNPIAEPATAPDRN